jgi:hypothetical protein
MLGINPHDGQAMYELQLELHNRAEGKRSVITADELLELHTWLVDVELDFKRLFRKKA